MRPHRRSVMGRMCLSKRRALRHTGCIHGADVLSCFDINSVSNYERSAYAYRNRVFPAHLSAHEALARRDGGVDSYAANQDFYSSLLFVAYPRSRTTFMLCWMPPTYSGPYSKVDRYPSTPTRPWGVV
jgi:hypothetical protein